MIDLVLSQEVLLALFLLSVVGFVGTLIAIPFILVRLPPHYFDERHPRVWLENHHPVLRLVGLTIKNVVGLVFLLAGLAMLFLPGQGVLTILIGLSLLDFPGKRALERKLVGQPTVLKAINALRAKFGRPPMTVKPDP
ncbi:PGPGW domain-containing protein [Nitrospira sp. Kam-Ns4a]